MVVFILALLLLAIALGVPFALLTATDIAPLVAMGILLAVIVGIARRHS